MFLEAQADRAQMMAELVGPAIGSAIGAALAAYLAITWGMSQLRDQRAFDRRLDWYEQTSRTLAEFQGIVKEVLVLLQLRPADVLPGLEKLAVKLGELSLQLHHAELYAGNASVEVVLRLREQLDGEQHRLFGGASRDASREESLRLLAEVLRKWEPGVAHARSALTADIREHLGLMPISGAGGGRSWFLDLSGLRFVRKSGPRAPSAYSPPASSPSDA